ncbi:PREDICTED: mediator of RNA polymerase II transcription subunit 15a-like isoform X2 [Ipomoea nil]|uniref:mediator of RNA polymerase II transcription subunit 15a-like isoform X2 n=1 Tax=Ipomoea nil TaxID=35883 RepID=UPI000900A14D|nr:PREDICTED: mediator of RNA polymerase II transcription subunit 15a-like isoform X2 [Ipomoea nil]
MDGNNWRAAQPLAQPQGGDPTAIAAAAAPAPGAMETGDWRTQLQPESRQRIVNKIMETLKRHLPFSGPEGLQELKKIAVRFEEKIYTAATNQSDYLRKISLKMLSMETKSQNPMANPLQANVANSSQNPQGTGSHPMQPQVNNQVQQLSVPMVTNQSQARQQLLSQNIQNNITSSGMQNSASLMPALPSVGNLTQPNIPSVVSQNSNSQNVQGIPNVAQNSVGNSMGHSNMVPNSQRQMQGRQQQVVSQQQQQQQQSQTPHPHLYQQQLRHHMMKQKFQSQVQQQQEQQQQQNLLQPTQIQSSQQAVMQPSTTQQTSLSNLQQNQQSSVQQPSQSMLQQRSQTVLRQQQQQQTPMIHQQQGSMLQQPMLQSQQQQPQQQQQQLIGQQQQQLIGQQQSIANIQQNQLIGQQNNIPDVQHQQNRLMAQQNNYSSVQQQQLINQQNNVPSIHQQQMGPQGNVAGLQQQQLAGNQSSNSGLITNQHIQMLPQSKVAGQQQMLPSATLLPTQGLQSQPQQQMMQQNQSQPGPLGLQQQANPLQREMQQRLQTPSPLLQQQNLIDQQKQNFQPQRAAPEASSNSTAQTGNANVADWQEDAYQKIKAMKETYYMDLNELFQKIAGKLAQHDSVPQQPKNEQIEKLKMFKVMVERLLHMLRLNKNEIQPQHKEKMAYIEKQIVYFLNSNRTRKPTSSMQQGQPPQPPQNHDGQINLQMQSVNVQGTMAAMQQNNLTNMQHNSLSSVSAVSNSQQNMLSTIQPGASLDIGQGSSLNSLQQVSTGALQQNPGSQQMNINSFSSQGGANSLQTNLQPNPNMLQPNSNMLQHQHPKQHEQQMLQNPQLRQQIQQRQMQQQILQKQQLMQQQQQIKQPQAPLAAQSMSQLHQMVDTNDIKMRQQIGIKPPGVLQQPQSLGQRVVSHHQQLKSSITSPQVHQTLSPQLAQHPSPQIDQQNMLASLTRTGTPLPSANSPFAPSPSTPLPGESEKVSMGIPSLLGAGNVGHQHTNAASASAQSLAIDTPGISASPLLPEINSLDGTHANVPTTISGKSSVEQPLERLVNAVRRMSAKALSSSVSDISSVVSMMDRIAGSAPGNGSRAAVGEDLVAMTKCRMQARSFLTQDGPTGTKRMKCYTTSNVVSSSGSVNDSFVPWNGSEASDLESTATSSIKRRKIKVNHALIEEIREINRRLIDTVLEISDEGVDASVLAATTDGSGGTTVKCSFRAVSLSPNLKKQYASAQMSPIQPLRLLVPANYPNCSPIIMDKFPVEVSKEYEDLSTKARSKFSASLRSLSEPMSLRDIARTWDSCARAVILEYAQKRGGGSFSSKYGTWEDCMTAA